jgi:hypothetical protein
MRAGHIMRKTAFVDLQYSTTLRLMGRNLLPENVPCDFVRPRMAKGFFYM